MGTCSKCGSKGIFLKTADCIICGRTGCEKCLLPKFKVSVLGRQQATWFCSEECFTEFKKQTLDKDYISELVKRHPSQKSLRGVIISEFTSRVIYTIDKHNKHFVNELDRGNIGELVQSASIPEFWSDEKDIRAFHLEYIEATYMALAAHLEQVGRYSEAADIYEDFQFFDKAKELRDRERGLAAKQTVVTVDLNKLLEQVKNGGIVAVYRCPHCGGKLKIDKNVNMDKLRVCEHCGSEIETMELADFLKTALS